MTPVKISTIMPESTSILTSSSPFNRESMSMCKDNQHLNNIANDVLTKPADSTTIVSASITQLRAKDVNEISPLEHVMLGIYLSKDFTYWHVDRLHSFQFTHIIIIDKHIQELCHPIIQNYDAQQHVLGQKSSRKCDVINEAVNFLDEEDTFYGQYLNNDNNIKTIAMSMNTSSFNFGTDFKWINLNFGEENYLTNVLPNCYRAVKFLDKALESKGKVLVVDCNGGEQKCLTIIVAYLMFKYNIRFGVAFDHVKNFYIKADLNYFYINQLYEYEPIVQVQRAQLRGHSCSRALHAATLKRKFVTDKTEENLFKNNSSDSTNFIHIKNNTINSNSKNKTTQTCSSTSVYGFNSSGDYVSRSAASYLLENYLNPLNDFNTTEIRIKHFKSYNEHKGKEEVENEEECRNFEMLDLDKTASVLAHLTEITHTGGICNDKRNSNIACGRKATTESDCFWNVTDDYFMK